LAPDANILHEHAGGGFRPHDGTLNPDEIAESIYQLQYENTYSFQAPVCFKTIDAVDFSFDCSNSHCRLTSKYDDLALVKLHEDSLQNGPFRKKASDYYVWLEGSVVARRYDSAINDIEQSPRACTGILNVIGLARYDAIPRMSCTAAIGFRDRLDPCIFYTMRSATPPKGRAIIAGRGERWVNAQFPRRTARPESSTAKARSSARFRS
jgi:hypothetical protein